MKKVLSKPVAKFTDFKNYLRENFEFCTKLNDISC